MLSEWVFAQRNVREEDADGPVAAAAEAHRATSVVSVVMFMMRR